MKYPAYPKYKDSGVEWLGEIPEEWKSVSLKWITKRYSGGTPDKNNPDYWKCGTIPWIASGEVNQWYIIEPTTYITEYGFNNSSAKWIPEGSVVMALAGQGKTKGMVALTTFPVTGNQSLVSIVPFNVIKGKYLLYWLHSQYIRIRSQSSDDLRDGLNLEIVGNIPCPLPLLSTQKKIATFLDTETAKIDGLIKDYEELITLLQEKRQALISHAVTRGLSELVSHDDPEFGEWAKPVKFKDSGVEWLGEIPEEWVIKSIKWITPVQRGASPRPIDDPKYFDEDGEYAWVRISDVTSSQDGYLRATTDQLSELGASLSVKIEPGSLFISIAGTVGKPCIAKIKACIHDGFVYFPLLDINPKYLFRVFESGSCYGGLGKFGTQLNLNTDTIGSIKIGVPPVNEIENILLFLDKELSKIDSLILETESAISLLKEHRSALITNAVTGKINVEALV